MRTYNEYINEIFPGIKVQKLSIDGGFTCPNRDGTKGFDGCIYCRNDSFTPSYCDKTKSISIQLEEGKKFFSRKYPSMKYLAYFQSYTNTHKKDIKELEKAYKEPLKYEDVVGIVIGTRPDSISEDILELLKDINQSATVFIELGAETSFDTTLSFINRNHLWKDVTDAVEKISQRNIRCGLHLIAGLPGETDEMVLETVEKSCSLKIDSLKLHQLQILEGTALHKLWTEGKVDVRPYELDDYIKLCAEIIKRVPKDMVIERFTSQSPPGLVVAPKWDIKNYQFTNLLRNYCKSNNIEF